MSSLARASLAGTIGTPVTTGRAAGPSPPFALGATETRSGVRSWVRGGNGSPQRRYNSSILQDGYGQLWSCGSSSCSSFWTVGSSLLLIYPASLATSSAGSLATTMGPYLAYNRCIMSYSTSPMLIKGCLLSQSSFNRGSLECE